MEYAYRESVLVVTRAVRQLVYQARDRGDGRFVLRAGDPAEVREAAKELAAHGYARPLVFAQVGGEQRTLYVLSPAGEEFVSTVGGES